MVSEEFDRLFGPKSKTIPHMNVYAIHRWATTHDIIKPTSLRSSFQIFISKYLVVYIDYVDALIFL